VVIVVKRRSREVDRKQACLDCFSHVVWRVARLEEGGRGACVTA
jgi:hypothetical protein